jgi:hypothetical protein
VLTPCSPTHTWGPPPGFSARCLPLPAYDARTSDDHLKAIIKWIVSFSSFHDIRNELLLEELIMDGESPASIMALYESTVCPPPTTPLALLPPHFPWSSSSGSYLRRQSPRGGREGGGFSRSGPTSHSGGPAWSSFYNLWTETISMWSCPTMGASSPRPHNWLYLLCPLKLPHRLRRLLYHTHRWLHLFSRSRGPLPRPLGPVGWRLGPVFSHHFVQHHGAITPPNPSTLMPPTTPLLSSARYLSHPSLPSSIIVGE